MTIIPFCDLGAQYAAYKEEIDQAIANVIQSSAFIMGPEVYSLEQELSSFTGAKHSISCANGTDAIVLALKALGISQGDEVIVPGFSFFASAEAVSLVGATPVFADVCEHDFNLNPQDFKTKISKKTKAVIPVSLYGQTPDMNPINSIAGEYGISVIEDAAQSFGATYEGKVSTNLTTIGTTSFFPSKPLGCYGDGGAIFTNDDKLAETLKMLRVHGWKKRYYSEIIGTNSRLDTIQAAILKVKLKYFPQEIAKRQEIALRYTKQLSQNPQILLPEVQPQRTSVWAQYTIRIKNRNEVAEKLNTLGIPTAIHYPLPLYRQPAYRFMEINPDDYPVSEILANEVLSLPFSAFLTEEQQNIVLQNLLSVYSSI